MLDLPQVLHRYIEGLRTHDVIAIADTVADDVAFVSPAATLNKTQFLDMLRALYRDFPDWHYVSRSTSTSGAGLCDQVAAGRYPHRRVRVTCDNPTGRLGADRAYGQDSDNPRAVFLL